VPTGFEAAIIVDISHTDRSRATSANKARMQWLPRSHCSFDIPNVNMISLGKLKSSGRGCSFNICRIKAKIASCFDRWCVRPVFESW
jgi:hypothetical protein